MKYPQLVKLVVLTAVVVIALIACLVYAVREVQSGLQRNADRIQKIEAKQNTLEVEDRAREVSTYDPCGLVVVECESEKYQLRLQ